MNSDIMVLISKPKGKSKLDPLRLQKSVNSSSDSHDTIDSQLPLGSRDRRSFIYPPDLRTAQ